MLPKMIYFIALIAIFTGEFMGIKYYIQKIHKGRVIDTIVAILLIIMCIVIISAFTRFYDKIFLIF